MNKRRIDMSMIQRPLEDDVAYANQIMSRMLSGCDVRDYELRWATDVLLRHWDSAKVDVEHE